MFKRITLLIFVVFNLNIYSQVVIKDEIVLDEVDNTEAETLQTPFYGNISIRFVAPGQKMRAYFMVDGQTKFLNEINGTTYNCICGNPLWPLTANWTFYGIPSGSDVELQVLQCQQVAPLPPPNGTCDWIELAVDLVEYPPTENRWKILVDVNYPIAPASWRYSGFITFIATTPPCNCLNAGGNCCNNSGWVQVPEVDTTYYSGNTTVISNYCSEHPGTVAAFAPVPGHRSNFSGELSSSNVIACYNQISQTWQFNLDQNVKEYYKIAICSTNVSEKNLTYINDTTNIGSIPSGDCNIALESFKAHREYKYDIGLAIPYGGYLITPVVLLHEEGHRDKWQKFMDDYFFIWESGILNFRADCDTYANIFEARMGGLNMYARIFNAYWEETFKNYQKYTGLDPYNKEIHFREEQRVNKRPEVQNLIKIYIKKLEKHCGIN